MDTFHPPPTHPFFQNGAVGYVKMARIRIRVTVLQVTSMTVARQVREIMLYHVLNNVDTSCNRMELNI